MRRAGFCLHRRRPLHWRRIRRSAGTSGDGAVTTGEKSGTSGWRALRTPFLLIAAVGFINVFVNASSLLMEAGRRGEALEPAIPFILEGTSYLAILALAPLIGLAVRRFPPTREGLARAFLIHAALTIPFSLAHVGLMAALRSAVFAAAGSRYGFFDDGVLLPLVYEWRKDVVTYAIIGAIFWYFQRRAETPPKERPGDERVEIRDGAASVFVAPSEILFVASAGNYVEFHLGARTRLVRGTLAAWEARLAPKGFARVHRSRLVNRARIAATAPTASGDLDITLDDGRVIAGSRRYREALES